MIMRPIGRRAFTLRVTSILPALTYTYEMTEERPVGASATAAGLGERRYASISAAYGPLLLW